MIIHICGNEPGLIFILSFCPHLCCIVLLLYYCPSLSELPCLEPTESRKPDFLFFQAINLCVAVVFCPQPFIIWNTPFQGF